MLVVCRARPQRAITTETGSVIARSFTTRRRTMPPKANHWSAALTRYAKATDPAALPSNEILHWDEQTITMYDGFDKAKFHFLVLPRIPFKRTASASALAQDKSGKPSLQAVGGRLSLGSSDASNIVPASHLQSITSLLRSPYAGEVLDAMERAGHETIRRIQRMMPSTPLSSESNAPTAQKTWPIHMGFHAVPSMDTVHLHVISSDLVSPRLKNKKHYISFHPEGGFWQSMETIQALVKSGQKKLPKSDHQYEELLKGPLVSFRTGETFRFMPDLKKHLELEWRREMDTTAGGSAEQASAYASQEPTAQPTPIVYRKEDDSVTESE